MSRPVVLLWNEDSKLEPTLTKFLEKNGFEVLVAKRELQCFRYLSSRHIGLVLLDIKRNDLEGLLLTKRIKSRSKLQHLPVVSVTELDNLIPRPLNISWGCDEYITKPINNKLLLRKIDFLMDKYFY